MEPAMAEGDLQGEDVLFYCADKLHNPGHILGHGEAYADYRRKLSNDSVSFLCLRDLSHVQTIKRCGHKDEASGKKIFPLNNNMSS
jgi:hypothetical protein